MRGFMLVLSSGHYIVRTVLRIRRVMTMTGLKIVKLDQMGLKTSLGRVAQIKTHEHLCALTMTTNTFHHSIFESAHSHLSIDHWPLTIDNLPLHLCTENIEKDEMKLKTGVLLMECSHLHLLSSLPIGYWVESMSPISKQKPTQPPFVTQSPEPA